MIRFLLAPLAAVLGVWAGRGLVRRRPALPGPGAAAVAGFLSPPLVAAWFGRPFLEQALAAAAATFGYGAVLIGGDVGLWVAFGLVGAAWGAGLGLFRERAAPAGTRPADREPARRPAGTVPPARAEAVPHPKPGAGADREDQGDFAFRLQLPCPTCAAGLAVPVYHRMARCDYCGSVHVVRRDDRTVHAVVPDALTSEAAVAAALLRHFRHIHYLRRYDQVVRPLVAQADAERAERPTLDALASGREPALVAAAEARVRREADEWAARAARRLRVVRWQRLLAPHWLGAGTLYQSGFGRDAAGEKRMEFAVTSLEASLPATTVPLPAMGFLSYLRLLRPLAGSPESAAPALAVDRPVTDLEARLDELGRRTIDLPIRTIARRATLVPEVVALVYRPWHVVEGELEGAQFRALVDGGSGRVEGEPPAGLAVPTATVAAAEPPPALVPNRCPECGGELPFTPEVVAHLCRTCFRVVALQQHRWRVLPYRRGVDGEAGALLPFWRFPLRLRTATGAVIVDLDRLTDGVDGTLDRTGDRPEQPGHLFVPAFRTRVSRAGVRLYRRLWHAVQASPPRLRDERFSPADPPRSEVVEITLPADEARVFGRVYLALAFGARDLARAQVARVREQFLGAEFEGSPELVFLAVPSSLLEPFRAALGRARPRALSRLEGDAPSA
jgi:hypothetical protein